jgi:NADP-dependent 3-hydroxy acid dehydrogenase YdfG
MDKKVMIITWWSDGLGKVCAECFMKEYQVVILSRSCDKIQALIDNWSIVWFACDITDSSSVQSAISLIISQFGRIDVLINNAWFWIQWKLIDCDDDAIKTTLEVNLLGQIYMTKYCISHLEKTKWIIININSKSSLYTKAERSVYHASKWWMRWFGNSITQELQPLWIRVTTIHPDAIRTWFFEKQWINKNLSKSIEPIEIVKMIEVVLGFDPKYTIPEFGIDNM